jgi:hypothetical protein
VKQFLTFVVGAAVGAIAAIICTERRIRRAAEEEIADMKAFYSSASEQKTEPIPDEKAEYEEAIKMYSAEAYEPEIIDPELFGKDGNAPLTYTLYSDGVITDEEDDIVSDVEGVLGTRWKALLPYTDSVYVRDAKKHIDIEIVADQCSYAETHPAEG